MINKAEVLFNEVQEALSQISVKTMGSIPDKIKLSLEELAGHLEQRKKEYKVPYHASYTSLSLRSYRVAYA